jgi:hypothetical protein
MTKSLNGSFLKLLPFTSRHQAVGVPGNAVDAIAIDFIIILFNILMFALIAITITMLVMASQSKQRTARMQRLIFSSQSYCGQNAECLKQYGVNLDVARSDKKHANVLLIFAAVLLILVLLLSLRVSRLPSIL